MVEEDGVSCSGYGELGVGIGEDDVRALSAQFERQFLEISGGVDVLTMSGPTVTTNLGPS